MILRRLTKHVKDQNWFAVALDFFIVVVGILIAFQITNWNEARSDRAETDRTLELLVPALEEFSPRTDNFKSYYATTKAYGETALMGWADEKAISDSAFLVAAYQASQIMGSTTNSIILAEIVGAENVRNIRDSDLQRMLQIYIASPSNVTRAEDLDTPYRQNIRRAMSFAVQERIRAECGDQREDISGILSLPPDCKIKFPDEIARTAAANLRLRTDLRDDLQWHMASTQSVLFDVDNEILRNEALIIALKDYLQ